MIQAKFRLKSEFSRNVLTLMTGTTIAQAIPIAISPILTRIYTPEDFGVYALFVAILGIFASISNGRYELAIMLPRNDDNAINIFALGIIIVSVVSMFLFVLAVCFNDYVASLLNNDELGRWLYFVPIAVFFTGVFNMLNYFNNRRKNYSDIASATILKSIVLAVAQLSIGLIKNGATGLISGHIFSQFVANTKLLKNIIKDKVLLSKIKRVKVIAVAKRYKNFPKYSMGGILANVLSKNLTNILISLFYNVGTLGLYSLVQRVVGMPSAILGGSIGQVFFQKATEEKYKTGKAIKTFNSTIKKLFMIAVPSFGVLFFIVEDLFGLVFGEEWRIAGVYAQIVIPLFFIKFIVSTVSHINNIFELQILALVWQVVLLLISLVVLYVGNLYQLGFERFLMIFTSVISLHYIVLICMLKRVSSRGKLR